jgi:hypothetical protein
MVIPPVPRDFKEFLKSLNSYEVEYLLVGGYAVAVYGYVRATNDLDVWVGISPQNAGRIESALRAFGFNTAELKAELFLAPNTVVRMGVPPLRLEVITSISGVDFDRCYAEREVVPLDETAVPVISLVRLRQNKAASGRPKDLADLAALPECQPSAD